MLSDFVVYDTEIQTSTIETLEQMTNAFNEASGGALVLSADLARGDFTKKTFFNSLASTKRRVNRYAANTAVASTALSQGETGGVKVAGGFGPVDFEESALTWIGEDAASAIVAIGSDFANELLKDQLNTAIAAGVAAISNANGGALANDVSATSGLTQSALNGSHAKFGDASQRLTTMVMDGAASHKLIDNALLNGEQLFEANNVTVINILNKRIVVTDAPALYEAGTPNKSKVLSLTQGAITVKGTKDIQSLMERKGGGERIATTWQSDYTFIVEIKGYKWDEVSGGKSPDDAALATGTNWDLAYSDVKNTAGVIAIADADL